MPSPYPKQALKVLSCSHLPLSSPLVSTEIDRGVGSRMCESGIKQVTCPDHISFWTSGRLDTFDHDTASCLHSAGRMCSYVWYLVGVSGSECVPGRRRRRYGRSVRLCGRRTHMPEKLLLPNIHSGRGGHVRDSAVRKQLLRFIIYTGAVPVPARILLSRGHGPAHVLPGRLLLPGRPLCHRDGDFGGPGCLGGRGEDLP